MDEEDEIPEAVPLCADDVNQSQGSSTGFSRHLVLCRLLQLAAFVC